MPNAFLLAIRVAGLPVVPDATALWGSVDLRDAQGKPLGQAVGGSSAVQRVAGKPDTVTGTWSIVLGQPLTHKGALAWILPWAVVRAAI